MKKLFVFAFSVLIISCNGGDNNAPKNNQSKELIRSDNSQTFNESFAKLMSDYYKLKDNFISESDTLINDYSKILMKDADSLNFNELKADTDIVELAKTAAANVSGELQGIIGEKNIENKRKSFYTLSEQLYDLIRTVQYNKEVVYHQYCSMVFNKSGATWLSNSAEIKNPYLPKQMPVCGEVTDSLDFKLH